MKEFSNLEKFGINLDATQNHDILCLPENINYASDISELRDTTDSIALAKLLKEEDVNCANSYNLGLDVQVYERRSFDLWLGTIYILKIGTIPLLMGIIGRLIGAKIEDKFFNKEDELLDKVHADINVVDGKVQASIKFEGDSKTFLEVLKGISESNIV